MTRLATLLLAFATLLPAAGSLRIYAIDCEGGKATLYVAPSGESLLIDAGYAGFHDRDTDRILAAAKLAGVTKIDFFVLTHYHQDHAGGVKQLAARIPIGTIYDHGPLSHDPKDNLQDIYDAFAKVRSKHKHLEAHPGTVIPIAGLRVEVVTSDGRAIQQPLAGAGQPNPTCSSYKAASQDPGENAHSLGLIITYGAFRLADLGDLFSNQEHDLVCPTNLLGPVDLYMTTHHGGDKSGIPQVLAALSPRAAIMNNGESKGGTKGGLEGLRNAPSQPDVWQLHYSNAGGEKLNAPEDRIANLTGTPDGQWLEAEAHPDGSFTIRNPRTKSEKIYPARTTK